MSKYAIPVCVASFLVVSPESIPESTTLALRWAPIHHQDVDRTGDQGMRGIADYICAVNYDGDWDTANNWDNLEESKLKACAYYSVVESETHWFILYGFYHPRDWTHSPIAIDDLFHENDMEGALMIVRKPTPDASGDASLGELCAMVTVAHSDFFSFVPKSSPWKGKGGKEDIDGEVKLEDLDGQLHPITAQEPRGHALKAQGAISIDGDGVIYVPTSDEGEVPTHPDKQQRVKYRLIDIFEKEGLWSHRDDRTTFTESHSFRGNDGDANAANPPWNWDDNDDPVKDRGLTATDPIALVRAYFSFDEPFSTKYISNPYKN